VGFGSYVESTGGDPGKAYDEAINAYQKEIKTNPNYPGNYQNLASVYLYVADLKVSRNESPVDALTGFRNQIQQSSDHHLVYSGWPLYLAEADLTEAEWLIKNGKSPEDALRSAAKNILESKPDSLEETVNEITARQHYWTAEWLIRQKK